VEIERPRDRTALNHDPRFKQIRRDIIGYLLGPGGKPKVSATRSLVLPDIEPEQLNRPPPLFVVGGPRRRSEERRETVELP
jgi:nitrate/nitrite transport system ATP-binding protein